MEKIYETGTTVEENSKVKKTEWNIIIKWYWLCFERKDLFVKKSKNEHLKSKRKKAPNVRMFSELTFFGRKRIQSLKIFELQQIKFKILQF